MEPPLLIIQLRPESDRDDLVEFNVFSFANKFKNNARQYAERESKDRERGTGAHASGLISLKAKERAHAMPCDAKRVSPTPLTLSLHRVFTVVFSFYNSRVQNILRASRLILRDQSHHPVAHLRGILIYMNLR